MSAVDKAQFRTALGSFTTGITVATSGTAHPHGMTLNALTSVSLEPPQILICVDRDARFWNTVTTQRTFAISVLSDTQEHVARHFATPRRAYGAQEFRGFSTEQSPLYGHPILSGCLTWLECAVADTRDSGDHTVFTGSVMGCGAGSGQAPLLFSNGQIHSLAHPAPQARKAA